MVQDFKDFISKGGIFEAAVGLIMALAFVPVVNSLVSDIIMPIVAAIVGEPDFSALTIDISDAKIFYGTFLTVVFTFIVIGIVMFLISKAYNNMKKAEDEADEGPSDSELLAEIRDAPTAR